MEARPHPIDRRTDHLVELDDQPLHGPSGFRGADRGLGIDDASADRHVDERLVGPRRCRQLDAVLEVERHDPRTEPPDQLGRVRPTDDRPEDVDLEVERVAARGGEAVDDRRPIDGRHLAAVVVVRQSKTVLGGDLSDRGDPIDQGGERIGRGRGLGRDDDPRRPKLRDGHRSTSEHIAVTEISPRVGAGDGQAQRTQRASSHDHVAARDADGLDPEIAGFRDRREGGHVEPVPGPAEPVGIGERMELDAEGQWHQAPRRDQAANRSCNRNHSPANGMNHGRPS
jgi:hypothetical protein